MSIESDLKINQHHLPPFSVGNCQQKISSFNPCGIRCTINGEWIRVNPDQPLKYRTVITGQDYSPPGLHHLNIGEKITIHCIQPLTQVLQLTTVLLRPAVPGSVKVYSTSLIPIPFSHVESSVTATPFTDEPCFVTYRPIMTMTVTAFKMNFKEWDRQNEWTLEASE